MIYISYINNNYSVIYNQYLECIKLIYTLNTLLFRIILYGTCIHSRPGVTFKLYRNNIFIASGEISR